jgi:hypothetical protein
MNDNVNKCLPALFEIADDNLVFARSIYFRMPKNIFDIEPIKEGLKYANNNIMSLSAEIAMDNFEKELSISELVTIQRSHNPEIRLRAKTIALSRKVKKPDFEILMDLIQNWQNERCVNFACRLVMINFKNKLSTDLLFSFLKAKEEETQIMAEKILLSSNSKKFSLKKLFNNIDRAGTQDKKLVIVSAKVLLKYYGEKLGFSILIPFLNFDDEFVQEESRKLLLLLPEINLPKSDVISQAKFKGISSNSVAIELMLKHYGNTLTAMEIIDYQLSKNSFVRESARILALSLPTYKVTSYVIYRAINSNNVHQRLLGEELYEKYRTSEKVDKEVLDFLGKHSIV